MRHHLDERGPLTLAEAVAVLTRVGEALAFAHLRGIVHRDLKAENLLLERAHEPLSCKLADFGIAKPDLLDSALGAVTSYGRLGTSTIMAPEQLLGREVDARTDIYAMGALIFQLLVGRLPFVTGEQTSASDLEDMHLHAPRPGPMSWTVSTRARTSLATSTARTVATRRSPRPPRCREPAASCSTSTD